jgi:phage gp36-like protein/phage gpG-like protein
MAVIAPTAYATVADLAQHGVAPAALAAVSVPNQQAAVDAANALADGYLAQHFRMPITSWGKDLVAQICRIAAYEAIVVRGANPNAPGVEDLHDRWQAAIRWFEQVAAGKITPTLVDSSPAARSARRSSRRSPPTRPAGTSSSRRRSRGGAGDVAVPIRGDFGRLEDLVRRAAQVASPAFRQRVLKNVAEAARTEIVLGFERSRDPYGNTWRPLQNPSRRRRGGRPLLDTGRLRSSWFVGATANGIVARTNVTYAGFHQHGTRRMVARPMVPTGAELGPFWRRAFEAVLERELRRVASP